MQPHHITQHPLVLRVFKKGVLALFIKLGAAGFSFLMLLSLSIGMDPKEFGLFSLSFSFATLGSVVGSLGMRNLVLKFASVYHAQNSPMKFYGLFRVGYLSVLIGSVVISIIGCMGLVVVLDVSFELAVASTIFLIVLSIAEFQAFSFRSFASIARSLIPKDILWRTIVILSAIFIPLIMGYKITALDAVYICTVSLIVLCLMQFFVIKNGFSTDLIFKKSKYETRKWFVTIPGFWGASIVQMAAPNMTVLIVGAFIGTNEAGEFFAAFRLALLLNIILLASNMVIGPLLSQNHASNKVDEIRTICKMVALISGLISLAAWLVYFILGKQILALFDPTYSSVYGVLLILAAGQVFNGMAGPTSLLLEMTDREKISFQIGLISNVIGIVLMIVLTQLYGAYGTAISAACILLISNIMSVIYIKIAFGFDPSILSFLNSQKTEVDQRK